MTIPRFLRRVFLRRRELLLDLAQSGAEAIGEYVRLELGESVCPGVVVSIATAGDMVQWHPHLHILLTDGGFSDGAFRALGAWDGQAVMRLFRERLLARLVERHAISRELAAKVTAWRHPGFSVHVGDAIATEDAKAIEDLAGYVVRNPLSLKRLVYLDGRQAVIYRGLRPNPRLGRNFESMDPLDWLARMTDHIPDPHRHRTLFYGHYANRVRGGRRKEPLETLESEAPPRRRCSPSWARLIAKVYQVDPLVCRDCGGPLRIIAYLHDQGAIRRILDHLGLAPPDDERPPPEVRYVPLDEDGRELTAEGF
jgi:hypothetical protein